MRRRHLLILITALLASAATIAVIASPSGGAKKKLQVKTAQNATLGKKILVNSKGRTLYTLSSEKKGKFTCTSDTCLQIWPPLTIAASKKPAGSVTLGTVKRPDGKTQITYKGFPLYTFAGDQKKGDVSGEGINSFGGIWHAGVVKAKKASASGTPPAPAPPAYPGY
jgi:predicted lipoprotein with Yx(FWY)xxD motif